MTETAIINRPIFGGQPAAAQMPSANTWRNEMNALELAQYMEEPERWNVSGVHMQECAEMLRNQHDAIVKLRESLDWYVKEDDVLEGDHWEEDNAFWLDGKRKAEQALKDTEYLK